MDVSIAPLVVGLVAAFLSGLLAIRVLLGYLRTHSLDIFVVYRFVAGGGRPAADRDRHPAGLGRHGGHEAAPPARHPRPGRAAPHPHPAGARGRPARARVPDDPGHDQPRRRRAGADQGRREGTAAYALPPRLIEAETSGEDRLRKLLSDLPLEIHEAGLLLVLRTLPGSAHAIAAALDRARWPEVAGSIAGDDTLFVALPDRGSLQRIKRRLLRLSEGGPAQP